jgi:hypothetical protein
MLPKPLQRLIRFNYAADLHPRKRLLLGRQLAPMQLTSNSGGEG